MKVTLYTKRDCSLCEEAEWLLWRLLRENRFELIIVDIEADSAANERYRERIPVVVVDGTEMAAPIDRESLIAALVSRANCNDS